MSEVNERDLKQVAGGVDLDEVQRKWYKANCLSCANVATSCTAERIAFHMSFARESAKRGMGYVCPNKS